MAKASKVVKAIKTAERIAGACRTVGQIGNTTAAVKACYDTYQTAQRECETTGGKIAYMAGTLLAGYAMGKAANWGANKLKNLANKALPKLKTAVQEGAGRLANQFRKGFGTSGSGHMSRNRGFVVNPLYKGGKRSRFPENPNDLFPENYPGLIKEMKPDGKINYTVQAGDKTYKIEYHPRHEGDGHYDGNHYHVLKLSDYPRPGKTKPSYFRIPNLDPDTSAQGGTFAPGDLLPTKNKK